jgi:uncharacterized protein
MNEDAGWLPGLYGPDLLLAFFSLLLEGVPFLVLGAVLSGLVDVLVPAAWLRRLLPRSRFKAVLAAMAAGFLFPLCECSGVPVVARLIRKGLPVSAAVTYLIASPMLNPLTLLSTWLAFQGQDPWLMAGLRLGLGVGVVFFLGLWMAHLPADQIVRGEVLTSPVSGGGGPAFPAVLRLGLRWPRVHQALAAALQDFLNVLVYFVIGAGFAAFFSVAVNRSYLEPLAAQPLAGPLVGAALSQILCLCSTSDAFVVAALGFLSVAGKLAFLLLGPIMDLKLFWIYSAVFQRRFVYRLWLRAAIIVLLMTWVYALR